MCGSWQPIGYSSRRRCNNNNIQREWTFYSWIVMCSSACLEYRIWQKCLFPSDACAVCHGCVNMNGLASIACHLHVLAHPCLHCALCAYVFDSLTHARRTLGSYRACVDSWIFAICGIEWNVQYMNSFYFTLRLHRVPIEFIKISFDYAICYGLHTMHW